jgi:tetratricopeptide (TPR) repeat protein
MMWTGDSGEVRFMIEAVYHACAAEDFDAAAAVLYNRVYRGPNAYFTHVLGGWETMLDTLTGFYPFRDLSLDPRVEDPSARRWILHETATCLHVLGRLQLASELAGRAAAAAVDVGDRHNAAISYHNLAESYLATGALASCRAVAAAALRLAVDAGEMEDELVACTILGRLDDLAEQHEQATEKFVRALEIAVAHTSVPLLYSLSGIRYADHLTASGRQEEALSTVRANLEFCREQGWQSDVALSLAQLATIASMSPEAMTQADEAVRISRTIGAKQTLAETLLARALLALRTDALDMARTDLSEALTHVQLTGYRLLEIDARTMLGMVRQKQGELTAATAEAELAKQLSRELDYERGYRRAEQVLRILRG